MRVFVFICLLLLLERTTAASYENIGTGLCACQNHERKNGLDLCSSEVFLGYGPYARPKLSEGSCVKLCDFAEDCAAYQYDGNCVLYLWGRPPAGVLDVGAIRERGPSGLARADFAVMPHERILKKENQFTQEEKFKKGKAGHQRICTCESRDIDEVEEDIMKSRKKFIIGRRGREQTVPSVLFFAGGQTVTGIAASNSEYKKKGGPRNSPLELYLQKGDTYTERIVGDGFHAHTDSSVLGGLYPAANIDQPRCV
eukprot:g18044.t1